jgi:hypothetical protein
VVTGAVAGAPIPPWPRSLCLGNDPIADQVAAVTPLTAATPTTRGVTGVNSCTDRFFRGVQLSPVRALRVDQQVRCDRLARRAVSSLITRHEQIAHSGSEPRSTPPEAHRSLGSGDFDDPKYPLGASPKQSKPNPRTAQRAPEWFDQPPWEPYPGHE